MKWSVSFLTNKTYGFSTLGLIYFWREKSAPTNIFNPDELEIIRAYYWGKAISSESNHKMTLDSPKSDELSVDLRYFAALRILCQLNVQMMDNAMSAL